MRLRCTGTRQFLKFYLIILSVGLAISFSRGGIGGLYLLGNPTSLLGTLGYSCPLLVTTSFVIGSCVWALLALLAS